MLNTLSKQLILSKDNYIDSKSLGEETTIWMTLSLAYMIGSI